MIILFILGPKDDNIELQKGYDDDNSSAQQPLTAFLHFLPTSELRYPTQCPKDSSLDASSAASITGSTLGLRLQGKVHVQDECM